MQPSKYFNCNSVVLLRASSCSVTENPNFVTFKGLFGYCNPSATVNLPRESKVTDVYKKSIAVHGEPYRPCQVYKLGSLI